MPGIVPDNLHMTTPKQKDPPENRPSHQELAGQALHLHNMTGGALIEVSDGTRRIKIGAWLPGCLRTFAMP